MRTTRHGFITAALFGLRDSATLKESDGMIGAFTLPDLRLWSVYEFGSSRSDGYSLSAIPYDRRCR